MVFVKRLDPNHQIRQLIIAKGLIRKSLRKEHDQWPLEGRYEKEEVNAIAGGVFSMGI